MWVTHSYSRVVYLNNTEFLRNHGEACSYMLTRHHIYVFMCSMHNTRNNAILLTHKYHLKLKWWSWVCVIVLITSYWFAVVTKTHLVWFRRYTPVYRSGIIICVLYFEYRIIPSCILHSIMHGSPLPSIPQ